MNKNEMLDSVWAARLGHRSSDLEDLMLPSIRLKTSRATHRIDENLLPVGASKLGGSPDLPPETEWPEWNEKPLGFLMQLRMEEATRAKLAVEASQMRLFNLEGQTSETSLPVAGILYFFYETDEQPWGYKPEDRGGWKVIYYDGDLDALQRTQAPPLEPDVIEYPCCTIEFVQDWTLPDLDSWAARDLRLETWEKEAYYDLMDSVHEGMAHRLLGHPQQIQGDMQRECQLVSHGLNLGDSWPQGPEVDALESGIDDWQLLLQVDSDESEGSGPAMYWGDVGRIYFWIQKDALARKDFENVWLILQCT